MYMVLYNIPYMVSDILYFIIFYKIINLTYMSNIPLFDDFFVVIVSIYYLIDNKKLHTNVTPVNNCFKNIVLKTCIYLYI